MLVDYDTDEYWKIEENIKAASKSDNVREYVANSVATLIARKYFDQYIKRWEYKKSIFDFGVEQIEK